MKDSDISRISHIKKYCEDIADAIQVFGEDYKIFEDNIHFVNSVSMSIMQIGELTAGLSQEFKSKNHLLWGPMKAMRNLFAHAYSSMNREIIWDTAVNDIPSLLHFCDKILQFDLDRG